MKHDPSLEEMFGPETSGVEHWERLVEIMENESGPIPISVAAALFAQDAPQDKLLNALQQAMLTICRAVTTGQIEAHHPYTKLPYSVLQENLECYEDINEFLKDNAPTGRWLIDRSEFQSWGESINIDFGLRQSTNPQDKAPAFPSASTLRNSQRHKERCRALAALLWEGDEGITIEDMITRDEITVHGCENRIYSSGVLRGWINDLAPNRKPGRRPQST